jgi:hypothetical protein
VDNRTDSKSEVMNAACSQWICIGIRSQEGGCLVLSALEPGLHHAKIRVLRNESLHYIFQIQCFGLPGGQNSQPSDLIWPLVAAVICSKCGGLKFGLFPIRKQLPLYRSLSSGFSCIFQAPQLVGRLL